MDIIGTIYTPAAEGEEPVALPGFHVNLPEPNAGWTDKQVFPKTPSRVYAGHPTYFYVFADEAEFVAIAGPQDVTVEVDPLPALSVESM